MELSTQYEQFIQSRLSVLEKMGEGEDKEKAIRNAVELMKVNTDYIKAIYSNSLEMAKLDSNESIEKDRLGQTKQIEELKLAQAKAIEELRLAQTKEIEEIRLAQSKELERLRAAQTKELELIRFDHENNLEAIRIESKRFEKTGIAEKVLQYGLRTAEVAVPVGLFIYAARIENLNGYLPNIMRAITTKIPVFKR